MKKNGEKSNKNNLLQNKEEIVSKVGIWCPHCKTQRSYVCNTKKDVNKIIRSRKCLYCGFNFRTIEQR